MPQSNRPLCSQCGLEDGACLCAHLAPKSRVTHRPVGVIPNCAPAEPSIKPFDAFKYWSSVNDYCREIKRYIAHMNAVRAGLIDQIDHAA